MKVREWDTPENDENESNENKSPYSIWSTAMGTQDFALSTPELEPVLMEQGSTVDTGWLDHELGDGIPQSRREIPDISVNEITVSNSTAGEIVSFNLGVRHRGEYNIGIERMYNGDIRLHANNEVIFDTTLGGMDRRQEHPSDTRRRRNHEPVSTN